jgi:peptidoglycan/xylan/chitin deacetylase (PgdA/CDA1 family)
MLQEECMKAKVVPTLMYHSVDRESRDYLTIGQAQFERQVAFLAERFALVLPGTFMDPLVPVNLQRDPVVISFDDSLRDNIEFALPVLEKYQARAIFFAIPGYLGANNGWNHRAYRFSDHMTTADLRALHACGHEIGSHSMTHQRMTKLDDRQLEDEMADSALALREILGTAPVSFAYPYGDADDRCRAACRRHYRQAFCSARQGTLSWELQPHSIRRIFVGPEDTPGSLAIKISEYLIGNQHGTAEVPPNAA